jgi:chemotaxis protein MotB
MRLKGWLSCVVFIAAGCGIDEQVHQRALDDLAASQKQAQSCEEAKAAAEQSVANLEAELDTLRQQSQTELAGLKTDLTATEEELRVLRRQREAAEKRLAAYRQLNERLRQLIDTGKLKVAFRNGQMVLELPSEILFKSGRARLSRDGKEELRAVAQILLEFKDRRFQIAGHTDDRKISTKRFPNNWHLSTARAVSILEFFIAEGFAPENLAATGFGEFDPIAPNDTPEGRQQNRRIEIILVPDLSELPNLTQEPAGG